MKPTLNAWSRERYRDYLRSFLPVCASFEEQARTKWPGTFEERRLEKTSLLRADLSALDEIHEQDLGSTRLPDVHFLSDDTRSLVCASEAELWGMAYVLEGSSLGASVIVRSVEDALGANISTRFLRCYDERLRAMWLSFVEALDAQKIEGADLEVGCEMAIKTFAALESNFEGRGLLV